VRSKRFSTLKVSVAPANGVRVDSVAFNTP
jgi:hypothetical protein